MKASSWVLIAVVVLMGAAIAYAAGFRYLQARLSPLAVGTAIVILAAAQLTKELRAKGKPSAPKKEAADDESGPTGDVGKYFLEGAWLAGFVFGMYIFGILVAILLFGVAYMRWHGTKWSISVLITGLLTLACWLVFSFLLETSLYPGLILRWLGYY